MWRVILDGVVFLGEHYQGRLVFGAVASVSLLLLGIFAPLNIGLWTTRPYREVSGDMKKPENVSPAGNVSADNSTFVVHGPAQIGGQGNVQQNFVSMPAFFERAVGEPYQDAEGQHLRVRFLPSPGRMWPGGTDIKFRIRLAKPCLKWRADPDGRAFGGVMVNVRMSAETNTDDIFFATTTLPRPGSDVVIDILGGVEPPQVTSVGWFPDQRTAG